MVEQSVLNSVERYLRLLNSQGFPVQFGIIFGSQVKGRVHEWSDIDLVVVSPRFDGVRNRRDVELLWTLAADVDCRIEPIACGARQWLEDDSRVVIEIARQEGEKVSVPGSWLASA